MLNYRLCKNCRKQTPNLRSEFCSISCLDNYNITNSNKSIIEISWNEKEGIRDLQLELD